MKLTIAALVVGALALATPAAAQRLPGYTRDQHGVEAEYRAYALDEFQKVLTGWGEAAREGDVEGAMRYYASNAVIHLDGVAQGADQVRELLTGWLGSLDDFRFHLADFDASGGMAYGSVNIVIDSADPDDDGDGTMVFVLRSQGRDWRIRSQTLVLD